MLIFDNKWDIEFIRKIEAVVVETVWVVCVEEVAMEILTILLKKFIISLVEVL